jgi:hypothetical protein
LLHSSHTFRSNSLLNVIFFIASFLYSRAAEIIATSGQAPIQNLGGFAQFLGGTAFSSTSTLAPSDIDSAVSNATLDPELVLVLKRLSKRDPITKLKALEEFESYLKSKERNENELTGILDLWVNICKDSYCLIDFDSTKKKTRAFT